MSSVKKKKKIGLQESQVALTLETILVWHTIIHHYSTLAVSIEFCNREILNILKEQIYKIFLGA